MWEGRAFILPIVALPFRLNVCPHVWTITLKMAATWDDLSDSEPAWSNAAPAAAAAAAEAERGLTKAV
jgi:hypothetical protein